MTLGGLGVDIGRLVEEGEVGDPGVVFKDGAAIVKLPKCDLLTLLEIQRERRFSLFSREPG